MDIGVGKQESIQQNLRGTICFPGTINRREKEKELNLPALHLHGLEPWD